MTIAESEFVFFTAVAVPLSTLPVTTELRVRILVGQVTPGVALLLILIFVLAFDFLAIVVVIVIIITGRIVQKSHGGNRKSLSPGFDGLNLHFVMKTDF
jgi:hypothetical protein